VYSFEVSEQIYLWMWFNLRETSRAEGSKLYSGNVFNSAFPAEAMQKMWSLLLQNNGFNFTGKTFIQKIKFMFTVWSSLLQNTLNYHIQRHNITRLQVFFPE